MLPDEMGKMLKAELEGMNLNLIKSFKAEEKIKIAMLQNILGFQMLISEQNHQIITLLQKQKESVIVKGI